MPQDERVAIVGIGGGFPPSADPGTFWAHVARGVAAPPEGAPGRRVLAGGDAYGPQGGAGAPGDATRGGFVEGFRLGPEGPGLDAGLLARLDPAFHLALEAGRQAWRDAVTEGLDRDRVGVVLGNIVLPTETASSLARATLGRTFAERLGVPSGADSGFEPLNTYAAGLPAGIVARALGLRGGSFTLDAACASSLYALKLASDELLAGRADAMLTGGISRPTRSIRRWGSRSSERSRH